MSSRIKKIFENLKELNNTEPSNLNNKEIDNKSLSPNIVILKNTDQLAVWNKTKCIKQYKIINGELISTNQNESCCVVSPSNQNVNYTLEADVPKGKITQTVVRNLFNSSPSNISTTSLIENYLPSSSYLNISGEMASTIDDLVINNSNPNCPYAETLIQNDREQKPANIDGPRRMFADFDLTTSKVEKNRAEDNGYLPSPDIGLSSDSESFSSDHTEYLPDTDTDIDDLDSSTEKISAKSNSALQAVYNKIDIIPNLPPNNLEIQSNSADTSSDNEPPTIKKKKKWVKVKRFTDLCYFCDTEVLNFARHIVRNHSQESEIQRILVLKPKSLERRRLIEAVRKRGNHLKNISSCVKAVKKSHVPGRNATDCIPCKHCLGYFRPEQLWRHVKRCSLNPGEKTKYSHKTDAQDVLIRHYVIDRRLKEIVFPTMRPDKVSLVAKQDALICRYGAQYLTSHREKHHVNVCSRKMRELAKLLIELRTLHPTIKNLFDALQPVYFDSFVNATKFVAGYDASNEKYKSSTFAMNISTSLKECCSLAIRLVLKKKMINLNLNTAEMEANFNTFQQLLKDSWKFEVSSVAAACLNTNKWNKITIVPLASDLQLFRNYLLEKANQAEQELKVNPNNEKAYKLLLEVVYCRSMLLNRKRGGEMQRILLRVYQSAPIHQSYEEFNDTITPTERILLKQFKRVVTRGKRDRGVPVLFSMDVQKYIEVLISLRANFVSESNTYLFPTLRSDTPIVGYKVMQKHTGLSGAKNPNAITSTRLRKHLATMSQILELSPNDVEQLATFMGHTKDIHKQVYRLPDDIYQTAKIAKLLVLMENGKAGQYKGKSLDEIEIDMKEELKEDDSDNEDLNDELLVQKPSTSSAPPQKKLKRVLVPWTTEQKNKINIYFKNNIKNKKALKKEECENFKLSHQGIFYNKTWQQIKVYVQNIYSRK